MRKEQFPNKLLDKILTKSKSETFEGQHGFVSIFEVLRQYFKCSNVEYSAINPLGVLRNLQKI